MKKIIIKLTFLLLILIAGITAVSQLIGYILIIFPKTTIEVPIWFFFIINVCFLLILYIVIRAIHWFWTLSSRLRSWFRKRNALRAQKHLQNALFSLFALDTRGASKQLDRAAEFKPDPLAFNILKIFTYQKEKHFEERDQCLQNLEKEFPKKNIEIKLFQARLQIEAKDLSHAQVSLEKLLQQYPHHQMVLTLLATVYYEQQQIDLLSALLPRLQSKIDLILYTQYEELVLSKQFSQTITANDLISCWKKLGLYSQANTEILISYVTNLLKFNLTAEAESAVRKQIDRKPNPVLYLLYATIHHDAAEQITYLENCLKKETGSKANLLFAAGQLCMRFQLWGKARDYFISSLQLKKDSEVYAELAKLYEQLGEKEKAAECWRAGLSLVVRK